MGWGQGECVWCARWLALPLAAVARQVASTSEPLRARLGPGCGSAHTAPAPAGLATESLPGPCCQGLTSYTAVGSCKRQADPPPTAPRALIAHASHHHGPSAMRHHHHTAPKTPTPTWNWISSTPSSSACRRPAQAAASCGEEVWVCMQSMVHRSTRPWLLHPHLRCSQGLRGAIQSKSMAGRRHALAP